MDICSVLIFPPTSICLGTDCCGYSPASGGIQSVRFHNTNLWLLFFILAMLAHKNIVSKDTDEGGVYTNIKNIYILVKQWN